MSYQIIWSPEANRTYTHILEYLEELWSEREINNLIKRTEAVLSFIRQNPLLYRYSKQKNTYKFLVLCHNHVLIFQLNRQTLYYNKIMTQTVTIDIIHDRAIMFANISAVVGLFDLQF